MFVLCLIVYQCRRITEKIDAPRHIHHTPNGTHSHTHTKCISYAYSRSIVDTYVYIYDMVRQRVGLVDILVYEIIYRLKFLKNCDRMN